MDIIMQIQFPYFSIILSLILCFFVAVKIGKKSKLSSKLPPGPWKLPFIGNIHQMVGSQPHHALASLAKNHGPLMSLQLGEVPVVVVSSADYAKEIMKTHDVVFASRPRLSSAKVISYNFTDIAFAPYGEYWRQLRKICVLELFSTKRVESFRPIREEEVSNLISWVYMKTGSPINLTEKIFSSTFTLVSRITFSEIADKTDEFISLTKETSTLAAGFNIGDVFPSIKFLHYISGFGSQLQKVHAKGSKILGEIIDEHIKAKAESKTQARGDDLVDVLLKFHNSDTDFTLTIDNIKAIIYDIFGAGGETSSATVDWAMVELIKHPKVMEKAQAEIRRVFNNRITVAETAASELKYLKLVIKETLRLHPPAPLLVPRENNERCEINGYEIPVGTRVVINAWTIGRDPKYWGVDAEKFYPERFVDSPIDYIGGNFEYIPFGAGRRICPGMTFGLTSVESFLSQLLYHFDWELPSDMTHSQLDMTDSFGLAMKRKDNLCLVPTPYCPITFS